MAVLVYLMLDQPLLRVGPNGDLFAIEHHLTGRRFQLLCGLHHATDRRGPFNLEEGLRSEFLEYFGS